jgi:hypothetical protein
MKQFIYATDIDGTHLFFNVNHVVNIEFHKPNESEVAIFSMSNGTTITFYLKEYQAVIREHLL